MVARGATTPQWSPDGTQIAYVAGDGKWRNIGVVRVSNGNRTMLTNDAWDNGNPKWSPDGRSIAYVANRQWNFHLMKVPAEGGASRSR